jgi:hypothetical protein
MQVPADKLDSQNDGSTAVWYVQTGPLLAALAPILVGLLTVPAVAVFQAMRGPVVPRLGGRDALDRKTVDPMTPIHTYGVANGRSSLFHVGCMISAPIEWSAGRFLPLGLGVL